MKKKIKIILFALITIIYIIIGAFLFLNIQLMEAPEIIISIEVIDLNSKNANLHTKIDVYNTNSFDIVAKNLLIITTTPDGYEVARALIQGGAIGSNQKKTFTEDITVAFNGHGPELLTSKITGEVGGNIFFIQKTIPLNIGIVTSLENIIDDLSLPNMNIAIEVADITTQFIEINATVEVFNPNNFEINIRDISNNIETKNGKTLGNLNIIGGNIPGKGSLQIIGNGSMLLEAFNEDMVNLNLSGTVGATIAGYEKNLSFNMKNKIFIPDLEEIVFSKDKSTILSIKIKGRLTLRGYLFEIIMGVDNTYNVDLIFKNITCEIFLVKNDENRFLGECERVENIIVESGASDISTCEVLVPYSQIFPLVRSNDWIMSAVSSRISIVGVNQSVYFEIRGYQDINIFT